MNEVYEVVQTLSESYAVEFLCRVLGVTRSAYYAYIQGKSYVLKTEKAAIAEEVKRVFDFHKRRYGWRRIQAESLFSRFKAELLDGGVFYGLDDAYYRTFEFIEGYYNTIRRHSSIGYRSPMKYEEQFWKNTDS